MENRHWLSKHLDGLDKELATLECDGLTRVISMILYRSNIPHYISIGKIKSEFGVIPHFWITLDDGFFIDYRAKLWLKNENNVPHGIFKDYDESVMNYKGINVNPDKNSVFIGEVLAQSFGLEFQEIVSNIATERSSRVL